MACKCYHAERNFLGNVGVCWGTKECEACSCGGDESKCDFYAYLRVRGMGKKYIEREAAINEIKGNIVHQDTHDVRVHNIGLRKAMRSIDKLPTADVVEVVRCRDCRYAYDSVSGWCCSHGVCVDCIVREDFYCADGERKESAT